MGNYDMERDTACLKIERVEQRRWDELEIRCKAPYKIKYS